MKLGIVVSEYYWEEITGKMLDLALMTAQELGVGTEVIRVPGSFDIPLAVKKLLKKKEIDGVVALGAIIQGETDHDGVIAYSIAQALSQLSLEFEKPVMLGVNGPKMTFEQGVARIGRAAEVVKACVEMVSRLK
jgi:6,7-dimethyl-8-ribityllumazine synthase